MPASKVTKKSPKRSVEDQYRSFTPREHVLNRSGMYIGDTANVRKLSWIMTENKKMELKDITYNPGVCKLFDELITNVLDEAKRDKTLTECKITFTDESFVVENNGRGIEIVKHSGGDCYLPEFLFGKMLTSSNYDDTEEREGAGTNGIGAKAVNIFSTEFEVKIVNGGKEYTQVWRNNMAERGEPKIKSTQSSKEYVRISAKPDWAKFDMEKLSSNRTLSVLEQRAYEISALCPDKQVSVSINGKKIPVKSFEDYVNLYLGKDKKEVPRVFGEVSDWQVCVAANPYDDFVQISTVNGCHTRDGGTHVDMLVKPMCKKIGENLASKHKDLNVPGRLVEAQLMVFVNAIVPNPKFSSQSKDQLITPWRDYRGKWPLEDLFVKKVEKLGILDPLLAMARAREMKALKTPKAKRGRLTDIPKLNDANKAGQGVESQKCTLILTEGDSAKSMAISGLESKMRDYFGVFPLKGKLLNTREVTAKKLGDNAEIQAIVRILGLQFGKKYTDGTRTLRYGKIMVMTDQDDDGFHIKGLLINFIHSCWPELLEVKNFVTAMLTPIVKARKGREVLEFYNTSDYTAWKDSTRGGAGYKVKYYKGLGTSSSSEAKEYFKQMKVLDYQIKNVGDTDSLVKAFGPSKTYSDARKEWIRDSLANPLEIDYKQRHFPISRFISEELVIFANTAVRRAIPSLVDGLKPSQRKVLFGCFKRNLKSEIKVAQLAGYISEHSAYHHGEMSLNETIVGMAQNFVGAKNMNLLHPSGQFGTRIKGGKDAASPRYIFTYLSENCGKLFDRDDEVNLNYLDDDGQSIEPEYYVPVLPLALVNGFRGIATGFSTECPAFNPEELKGQLLELIKHDGDVEAAKLKSLRPWYRNFKGEIYEKSKNKWMTIGAWKKTGANSVEITELPIGTWTDDYVEFLKTMETEGNILRFDDYSSENEVKINVLFDRGVMDKFEEMEQDNEFEQYMKLTSNLSATNMHVIDAEGEIRHMNDPLEILVEFYKVRSRYYKLRYDHLLKKTKHEMSVAKSKIKFIKVVSSGNLNMTKMKRSEIVEYLRENKYYDYGEFAYLLDMRMVSMSEEKVALLNEEINKKAEFEKEMRNKVPHDLWVEDLS